MNPTVSASSMVLPALRIRSILFQVLLVASAVALPWLAHAAHAPVYWLLPMHFPVILAGLAYGPIGGLSVGLLSPVVSCAISGMPPFTNVPLMTIELMTYGLLAGFLRGHLRWSAYASVLTALIAGRIMCVACLAVFSHAVMPVLSIYAVGLPAMIVQIVLLPFLARWWIDAERRTPAR